MTSLSAQKKCSLTHPGDDDYFIFRTSLAFRWRRQPVDRDVHVGRPP